MLGMLFFPHSRAAKTHSHVLSVFNSSCHLNLLVGYVPYSELLQCEFP